MKRALAILVLALCPAAFGANIYFAPSATGSGNGTSCSNAYAYNDGTHGWSLSAQQAAGNVLHVCSGTYTIAAGGTILSTVNSGTSGSPITMTADQGAVTFQAPYFSSSGGLDITNNYWTINGISYSNFVIQNTDNGTLNHGACVAGTGTGGTCGHAAASILVHSDGTTGVTIENLSVLYDYVLTPSVTDTYCFSNCQPDNPAIQFINSSHLTIDHVLCHDAWNCFNGWGSNDVISFTTAYNAAADNWALGSGNFGPYTIHDNWWYGTGAWWTSGDDFHLENGHYESDNTGFFTGLTVYNNKFGPESNNHYGAGAQTDHMYLSGAVSGALFFNNLFANSSTDFMPALEIFSLTNPNNVFVNNTMLNGAAQAGAEGFTTDDSGVTGTVFQNNIVTQGNGLISMNGTFASGGLNYNAYDSGTANAWGYHGTNEPTLSDWQSATGQDGSAIAESFSSLKINATGTLQTGSPAIGLGVVPSGMPTAYFTGAPQNFGVSGSCGSGCVARASSGTVDAGAYPFPPASGFTSFGKGSGTGFTIFGAGYNPHFPSVTNSQLAQNLVAGCNSGIPTTTMCQGGSASNTTSTYSISSGVVTFNLTTAMSTPFSSTCNSTYSNCTGAISGCTSATQMNGLILKFNSSTTSTALVGTLVNTQGAAVTPSNVSSTPDTTCYVQGPGWQPFVLAPFPAPQTANTSCPSGNGSAGCTASTTSSPSVMNQWALDYSTPAQNSSTPVVPIVQITDLTLFGGHSMEVSVSGETNDINVSWDDLQIPDGYFFCLVEGGACNIGHGHMDLSACNNIPCFMTDVTTQAGLYHLTGNSEGGFSRNPANRPGANQAIWYQADFSSCELSGACAPVINKYTLQYSAGAVTLANTSPIANPLQVYDIRTCPGFGYTTIGTGLAHTTQFRIDNFDNNVEFGFGSGAQDTLSQHMQFQVSLTNGTCATFDTAGMVGPNLNSPATNLYEADPTHNNAGTGYAANDTVTFSQAGSTCSSTLTLFSANIGASGKVLGPLYSVNTTLTGAVTVTGTAATVGVASTVGLYIGQTVVVGSSPPDNVFITNISGSNITGIFTNTHSSGTAVVSTMLNNSGCVLQTGVTTSTSGSGTGLEVDIDGIGTPSVATVYPPIASASCPVGSTLTCETGVQPCDATYQPTTSPCTGSAGQQLVPYGTHSGSEDQSGTTVYNSGHGTTWQTIGANSGYVAWNPVTSALTGSNVDSGHPGLGWYVMGITSFPGYYVYNLPEGFSCGTLGNPTCAELFQYPSTCNTNPGGSDNHSMWASPQNNTVNPILMASTYNGVFTRTNPPAWTCGMMSSLLGITQSGGTNWFAKWYDNSNNTSENFSALNSIMNCSPDEKFCLSPTDMNSSPGGNLSGNNTGLGTSIDTPCSPTCQPYIGIFSYTLQLATQ